jgi:hypothetical protein
MTVVIRIALRYFAMLLVTKGWLNAQDASSLQGDTELIGLIEAGVGVIIALCVEVWTVVARRMGWRT